MNFIDRMDGISVDMLRETGATKWAAEDGSIGVFVAEMDFGTAPAVTEALHKGIDDGHFGYLPPSLVTEMQEAASDWLKARHRWDVAPGDIRQMPDVIKVLEIAIEHFSKPGSKVIVPTPSYMPFLFVPQIMGRELIQVPMISEHGRYRYDLDALQKAYDDGGDLLILCNPYNPVGRVFSREELTEICDLVDRNGGRVFSDEIWAPLVMPGQEHISYASINDIAARHTLTAISASKAFNLPGLKCAQLVISSDADREKMDELGRFAGHGTANFGVIANSAAFKAGGAWLDELILYLDRNRKAMSDLVSKHLPGVRYAAPDGTYVGWLDFRDSAVSEDPAAFFKQHAGVVMTEGTACGEVGEGFARFILATPLPVMEQAVTRMGEALAEKGPTWPANR